MPTDPTALLRGDHRQVERLIHDIEQADGGPRRTLVEQLDQALSAHMRLEEDVLYPVVAEALGKEQVAESETEHELARIGLKKVVELAPDGPGFMAALEMLRAGIGHHVQDEEQKLFPELHKALDADQRVELADDIERARAALGLPSRDDLPLDASKDELYEQAKKAEVPGRSSMTKDELAQAVPPESRS